MHVFLIISGLLLTSVCFYLLITKGPSSTAVGGLAFFGGGSLVFIFQDQWMNWMDKQKEKRIESSNCQIQSAGFYFPKGYPFKQGLLKKQRELPFHKIKEIRINTFPPTAVTDGNEVIFLIGLKREAIEKIAFEQQLKLIEPLDIWSLICDEFLDTEFSEEEKEKSMELLERHGISRAELSQIKKRIRTRMLLRTSVSWEWMYYGQYDVLHELWPLTEKKYWWTMDIALRNG